MRKMILTLFIVLTVLGTAGCDKNVKEVKQKSIYEHGLEVIHLMSEMAQSTAFSSTYTGNESILNIIHKIGDGNYEEIKKVYMISFDKENLENMTELAGMSDELKGYTMQRMITAIVSYINAYSGAEKLSAASVCAASKTFVSNELDHDSVFIYTYKDAYPVAVTFIAGEDNSVLANGMFLVNESFSCDSPEDIQNFFEENGIAVNVVEHK